jgi:zinc transporter ZupT
MTSPFIAVLALSLPILITGLVAFRVNIRQSGLRLILGFSAGYLFSISIRHMLPELFVNGGSKFIALFIVLGFCLQLMIDTFSTGIEHGHVHLHNDTCQKRLPFGIIIGLLLHSFLEGLPIYESAPGGEARINFQLILGLGIHNLPITIAFAGLLKEHSKKHRTSLLLLLLFSFMSPLGYFCSYVLQQFGLNDYALYSQAAYALVIGIFLHISTAILFETSVQHKYNVQKILVMSLGILLAYFLS